MSKNSQGDLPCFSLSFFPRDFPMRYSRNQSPTSKSPWIFDSKGSKSRRKHNELEEKLVSNWCHIKLHLRFYFMIRGWKKIAKSHPHDTSLVNILVFRDPDTWKCLMLNLNFLWRSIFPGINMSHPPERIIIVETPSPSPALSTWQHRHHTTIIITKDLNNLKYTIHIMYIYIYIVSNCILDKQHRSHNSDSQIEPPEMPHSRPAQKACQRWVQSLGGCHSHGESPLDRWMVYFMEHPNQKWMITRGTPHFRKPSNGAWYLGKSHL